MSRNDRVTVHELLLAQRQQVASDDEPGTFKGTCGRERPTRTTLPLVLHWRHRSPCGPVHMVRVADGGRDIRHEVLSGLLLLNGYPAQHWFPSQVLCEPARAPAGTSPAVHAPSTSSQPRTLSTASRPSTERSNIDRLSAKRPSVCCFGQSPKLHLQLRRRTPDAWLVSQREGAANEHFKATGGVDRFEVTAVEVERALLLVLSVRAPQDILSCHCQCGR